MFNCVVEFLSNGLTLKNIVLRQSITFLEEASCNGLGYMCTCMKAGLPKSKDEERLQVINILNEIFHKAIITRMTFRFVILKLKSHTCRKRMWEFQPETLVLKTYHHR